MNTITQTYPTKELRAQLSGLPQQIDLQLELCDIRFVMDFIKNTGFYIEDFEDYIGEELIDFWQTREHALRILTDWMLHAFTIAQN